MWRPVRVAGGGDAPPPPPPPPPGRRRPRLRPPAPHPQRQPPRQRQVPHLEQRRQHRLLRPEHDEALDGRGRPAPSGAAATSASDSETTQQWPILVAHCARGGSGAGDQAPAFRPAVELRPTECAPFLFLRPLRVQPEDPVGEPCEPREHLRHFNVRAGRLAWAADPSGHRSGQLQQVHAHRRLHPRGTMLRQFRERGGRLV